MKIERFKLIQLLFFTIVICGLSILIYMSSATYDSKKTFENTTIEKQNLDTDRQLVTVNVDSLETLFIKDVDKLFTYNRNSNKLKFETITGKEKEFQMYFFNGNTSIKKYSNSGVNFNENPFGFEVGIIQNNKVPYALVPAEIVQNILTNK